MKNPFTDNNLKIMPLKDTENIYTLKVAKYTLSVKVTKKVRL